MLSTTPSAPTLAQLRSPEPLPCALQDESLPFAATSHDNDGDPTAHAECERCWLGEMTETEAVAFLDSGAIGQGIGRDETETELPDECRYFARVIRARWSL